MDDVQRHAKGSSPHCYYSDRTTNFAVQAVGVVTLAHGDQNMQLRLAATGRVRISVNGRIVPALSIAGKTSAG